MARVALVLAALCINAAFGTWYNVVPDCEFAPGVQCRQIVDGILATTANPVWRNTDVVIVTFIDAVNYNTAKVVDFFNVDNYYSSYNWAIPLKVEVYTNCPDKDSPLAQCTLTSTQAITPGTGTIGDFSTTTYTQSFPDSSGVVKIAIYPTPGTAICLVEVQAFFTAPPPTLFPFSVLSITNTVPSVSTDNNPSGCCKGIPALTDGVHATLGLIPPSDVVVFNAGGTLILQLAQRIELTLVSVSYYHLIRRDVSPITGLTFNVPSVTAWISDDGVNWTPGGSNTVPVFVPLDNDIQFTDITFNGVQTNFIKLVLTPGGLRDSVYVAVDEVVVGGHVPTVSPSVSSSPAVPSGAAPPPAVSTSATRSPSPSVTPSGSPIVVDIKLSTPEIGVNGGQTQIVVHLTGDRRRAESVSVTLKFDGTGSSTALTTDYTLEPVPNVVGGFPQITVMIAAGSLESLPIKLTAQTTKSVAQQQVKITVAALSGASSSGPLSSTATATIKIINACLSNPPPCVDKATCQNLASAAASFCQCPSGYTGDGYISTPPWNGNGCSCATDNLLVNGKATVGVGTPGGRDGLGGWTVTGSWTTTMPNSIPTRSDDPARNAFGTTVHKGTISQDVDIVCQAGQVMEFGGIVYGVGPKDDVRLIVQYLGKNGNSKTKIVISGAEKFKERQGPQGNWVPISVSSKVPKNVAGARLTVEIQRRGAGAAAPVVFIDNLYFQAKVFRCPAWEPSWMSPRHMIRYGCTKDGNLDYPCAIGCKDGYVRSDTRDNTPMTGYCKRKEKEGIIAAIIDLLNGDDDDDMEAAYDIKPSKFSCVGWSANSYQQD